MDEEDEVDIVGELNNDITGPSTTAYEEMGLSISELLPFWATSSSWLVSTEQVWNPDVDERAKTTADRILQDDREASYADMPSSRTASRSSTSSNHKRPWTESEKDMFEKGLEMFGHSWSKISKYLESRTALQVKNYARTYLKQNRPKKGEFGLREAGSAPIMDSLLTTVDMDCVYSTASPTVPSAHNSSKASRQLRNEGAFGRKLCSSSGKPVRSRASSGKRRLQQATKLLLDSNEIVIRIKKKAEVSEDEDVDIDDDDTLMKASVESDLLPVSEAVTKEQMLSSEESCLALSDDNDNVEAAAEAAPRVDDSEEGIFDLGVPGAEVLLSKDTITEEEKVVHREFFENRPQKTPERYLKIRNYIIESWEKCKPVYLNKTSVRPGLKNCGDVNCIGRIHTYLEQTGAINFGCDQTVYTRPLVLFGRPQSLFNKKSNAEKLSSASAFTRMETMRPRKRKPFPVLTYDSQRGGYTIEHDEHGQIVDVSRYLEQSSAPHKRCNKSNEDPFKLVFCSEFSSLEPPPFTVELDISCLIIMDIHAHMSTLEVIGLLGGHFDSQRSVLRVKMAEPCESSSTGQECEMDPVSQTLACDKLESQGVNVVGWYHSHPTFAPNPSLRDLDTQAKFQEWFSQGGSPFLGVIISPNLRSGTCSKLRYLVVGDETVFSDNCSYRKPYKFSPTILNTDIDSSELLHQIRKLFEQKNDGQTIPRSETSPSLADLNKMLSSFHHQLIQAKVDQMTSNTILSEFGKILVGQLIKKEEKDDADGSSHC